MVRERLAADPARIRTCRASSSRARERRRWGGGATWCGDPRARGAGGNAAALAAHPARRAADAPGLGDAPLGVGTRRPASAVRQAAAGAVRPAARHRRRAPGQHDRVAARRRRTSRDSRLQPLLRDPHPDARDAGPHRHAGRRPPGRRDARLHLRLDGGPGARGLRARREGGRRARPPESHRRRAGRGQLHPPRLRVVRRAPLGADAARPHGRRAGLAGERPPGRPPRRRRLRPHRRPDEGLAATHALRRHRPALGAAVAKHAR